MTKLPKKFAQAAKSAWIYPTHTVFSVVLTEPTTKKEVRAKVIVLRQRDLPMHETNSHVKWDDKRKWGVFLHDISVGYGDFYAQTVLDMVKVDWFRNNTSPHWVAQNPGQTVDELMFFTPYGRPSKRSDAYPAGTDYPERCSFGTYTCLTYTQPSWDDYVGDYGQTYAAIIDSKGNVTTGDHEVRDFLRGLAAAEDKEA